ncbi:MAG: flagellar basal body-associated FliL family protein [Fretibacterium sp.]|nr:flagellar basal body-associated FliL family protein [Fretibacterium sp.]
MRRIIIFIVVGLLMFGLGFGGGLLLGRSMASADSGGEAKQVRAPGPILSVGEFTSNLAGAGKHVTSFTVALELLNDKAMEIVGSEGWLLRVKNEILLIVKDKLYDDLNSAEGALQFAGDIKRTLNALLPELKGEPPVVSVLFETFVLQ